MNPYISFTLRNSIIQYTVSIGGVRTTPISTGIRVKNQKELEKAKKESAILSAIQKDILDLYSHELLKGNRPTARELVQLYRKGERKPTLTLASVSEEYLDTKELAEGTVYKRETVRNHEIFHKKLLEYLRLIGQLLIGLDIKYSFAKDYERYMLLTLKYDVTTVRRRIGYLRQVLHFAIERGYIESSPLLTYKMDKVPYKEKPLVYLTREELQKIEELTLTLSEHLKARDMLIFCYWTGCNYGDMDTFDYDKHIVMYEGRKWIHKGREKGNRQKYFSVPLFPEAEQVLQRNNYQLDVLSLGCYNRNLKELATLADIDKPLSSKVGRKGFAHHHFNELDLDDTVVSAMMGNTSKVLLKHYTRANFQKINDALKKKGPGK